MEFYNSLTINTSHLLLHPKYFHLFVQKNFLCYIGKTWNFQKEQQPFFAVPLLRKELWQESNLYIYLEFLICSRPSFPVCSVSFFFFFQIFFLFFVCGCLLYYFKLFLVLFIMHKGVCMVVWV